MRVEGKTLCAQRDLLRRFLAAHVKAFAGERRTGRQRLKKQRRLADSRIAAQQHDLPGDEAAAERAIELA